MTKRVKNPLSFTVIHRYKSLSLQLHSYSTTTNHFIERLRNLFTMIVQSNLFQQYLIHTVHWIFSSRSVCPKLLHLRAPQHILQLKQGKSCIKTGDTYHLKYIWHVNYGILESATVTNLTQNIVTNFYLNQNYFVNHRKLR